MKVFVHGFDNDTLKDLYNEVIEIEVLPHVGEFFALENQDHFEVRHVVHLLFNADWAAEIYAVKVEDYVKALTEMNHRSPNNL